MKTFVVILLLGFGKVIFDLILLPKDWPVLVVYTFLIGYMVGYYFNKGSR